MIHPIFRTLIRVVVFVFVLTAFAFTLRGGLPETRLLYSLISGFVISYWLDKGIDELEGYKN